MLFKRELERAGSVKARADQGRVPRSRESLHRGGRGFVDEQHPRERRKLILPSRIGNNRIRPAEEPGNIRSELRPPCVSLSSPPRFLRWRRFPLSRALCYLRSHINHFGRVRAAR